MLGIDNALRDPVHGWIKFTDKEKKIIDCGLFQRLKFVSQLTATQHVYPGGCHSRFIHSLGVMKIAGKYMKHLLREKSVATMHPNTNTNINKWIQIARIAGLLHDIGHGPFSHAFDRTVYSKIYGIDDGGHDKHRLKLITQNPLKEAIEGCGVTNDDILNVWTANTHDDGLYWICKLIIGGPLGADRIDFVLRDSYFTGTKHLGTIAWKRIIYNSTIVVKQVVFDTTSGDIILFQYGLVYAYKTLHDIIQALDGRRYMYHGVYLHKTVDAASILIENMMEELDNIGDIPSLDDSAPRDTFVDIVNDIRKFELLTDYTLIGKAMNLSPQSPARAWCERLLRRELPKLIKEEIVDATTKFNKKYWIDEWFSKEEYAKRSITIRRTRCITGIDPFKFDQYGLQFYRYADDTHALINFIDCKTALQEAHSPPAKPYYIVRAYDMSGK